jgi:predicted cobalt transporter CbtA
MPICILATGPVAGAFAGSVVAGFQAATAARLIPKAKTYEKAKGGHDPEPETVIAEHRTASVPVIPAPAHHVARAIAGRLRPRTDSIVAGLHTATAALSISNAKTREKAEGGHDHNTEAALMIPASWRRLGRARQRTGSLPAAAWPR